MSAQIEALIKRIKKDAKVLRLEDNFQTVSYFNLPVAELLQEIETLHAMRPIRTLNVKGGGLVERIIEASASDQATRSRLTEITIRAYKAEKTLESTLEALRDYLIVEYATQLSVYKTKEERLRVIEIVLSGYTKYLHRVQRIQNMATFVIKDIDQAAWSLKGTIEALKMINKPEHTI